MIIATRLLWGTYSIKKQKKKTSTYKNNYYSYTFAMGHL